MQVQMKMLLLQCHQERMCIRLLKQENLSELWFLSAALMLDTHHDEHKLCFLDWQLLILQDMC